MTQPAAKTWGSRAVDALDRAIAAVAPSWGVKRLAGREVLNTYRGAIATRTQRPFAGGTRSYAGQSSAERIALGSMRDRARKVYRDNPIGRSLLNAEVDNVVAEGMTVQARTSSQDFNRECEERFNEWFDAADVRGVLSGGQFQRMLWASSRRDGDAGVILMSRGDSLRLQMIPGDLVSTPTDKLTNAQVIDGVEVDGQLRPVGYHVESGFEGGRRKHERIAADDFILLSHIDEPLQVRGASCYQTVFGLLDQIDGYVDAVIVAARMAAIFGLIIKEPNAANQFAQLPTVTNSQGQTQRAFTMENGSVKYMGAEGDVVQVQAQQPMNQTPDFIRAMMRLIGLPFDMPLELTLRDVSQVNFASARIGLLSYYRATKSRQAAHKRALGRIYRWFVGWHAKRDKFSTQPPQDLLKHEWMAREWLYTDPVAEKQADLLAIDMGIDSPQNVSARHGRDYETTQRQIAEAAKLRTELGLPAARSTYTRDTMGGATPPAEGGGNEDLESE